MKSLKKSFKKLELKKTAISNLSLQKQQMDLINGGLLADSWAIENTSRQIIIPHTITSPDISLSVMAKDDFQPTCTGKTNGGN